MTYIENSRRIFLKTLTTTALIAPSSLPIFADIVGRENKGSISENTGSDIAQNDLPLHYDGPASPLFEPLDTTGNFDISKIDLSVVSEKMAEAIKSAPTGNSVAWGIPFNIPGQIIYLKNEPFKLNIRPRLGNWIVFMHTSDRQDLKRNADGFYEKPFKGIGQLNEEIAKYFVIYEDGMEVSLPIRQRHQIGMFQQWWGENCTESVANYKPGAIGFDREITNDAWGWIQTRVNMGDRGTWINWLWAWENPNPEKKIQGFRFEPLNKSPLIISAISIGNVTSNPLRWSPRQKAILSLPKGSVFNPNPDDKGLLPNIQLDLGQVISAVPGLIYPDQDWTQSYNNKIPQNSENKIIIEYAAHPEAMFHLFDQEPVPISNLINNENNISLIQTIKSADQKVKIRVVEKGSGRVVPVKFHAHGESGEYLAPMDRHRQPNNEWFEDYSVDFINGGTHICTYIPGETLIKFPIGKVYIEISKGFEITPVRKVIEISRETEVISIEIEKALNWREKGWVTADTHVHFLSPGSAMLEGSAEGVNIINLLASQWGELMTNVGDFDGKTTYGAKTSGGDGEYLVRVGTENRQHVMGHISLLGYENNIITPLTTAGPDEAALGDPIEMLLTEWAMQCKKQNGIVIIPHFPNPRLENAAAIISGGIDGVEMTSWGNLYGGIDPYSLTDWYRYLNCGYFFAAVGGTDKMSAGTAVGTIRTYAKIPDNKEFTYDEWKECIRRGQTFVTYGPLVEFYVEGKPAGSQIEMSSNGGTVNITWEVASVTMPVSRVELIVNGEVKESVPVSEWRGNGNWSVKVSESSWIALMVRGKYPDKPEIIAAHTSPVMIKVKDSPMLVATDALTILDQVEGAMAYLDTIGTRAEDRAYKRMRMVLTSAHRTLHNRMHEMGYYHQHTPVNDHPEHH
jgi:hypothetical protein